MTEGSAASWKETLIEEAIETSERTKTKFTLGTFKSFADKLKEFFSPYDAPGDALHATQNPEDGTEPHRGTHRPIQDIGLPIKAQGR